MKKKIEKQKRVGKILKSASIILACYFAVVFLLRSPASDFLTYPNLTRAKYYQPLSNWNLPLYGARDFDEDGKTDSVFVQGCVLLTSRDETTIPADRQCRYSTWGPLSPGLPQDRTVAEKYIDFGGVEMAWNTTPIHSYMIKQDDNSSWTIVAFSGGKIHVYEIGQDGSLIAKNPTLKLWLNALIYISGHVVATIAVKPLFLVGYLLNGFGYIIFPLVFTWTIFLISYNKYFRPRFFLKK